MKHSQSKSLIEELGRAALAHGEVPAPLAGRFAERARRLFEIANTPPHQLNIALAGLRVQQPDHFEATLALSETFAQATVTYGICRPSEHLEIAFTQEILALPTSLVELIPNARTVLLKIDSNGGSAAVPFHLKDLLRTKNVRVEIGLLAASAAAVIAQLGGHRVISHGGFIMLHPPNVPAMGTAAHLRQRADELDWWNEQIANLLATRTGQSRATVEAWLSGPDVWFDARQALAAGLVDEIAPPNG